MARILRTTLIGGLLFLVPVAFLLLVLGHAWRLAARVSEPVHEMVPTDTVGGALAVDALILLLLLLVCLAAGVAAERSHVRRRMARLDALLIDLIPGYAVAKGTLGGVAKADEERAPLVPVHVRFDDYAAIAFEVERGGGGQVTVFLPGSPTAWSGTTVIVEEARVTPLNVAMHEVNRVLRVFGRGTLELLDRPPEPQSEPESGPQSP